SFVGMFDAVFGGFQERADQTYRVLQAEGTAFVVVAVPEHDALREASYFVDRLRAERMPLAGLVLNRTQRVLVPELSAERGTAAAEALEASGGHPLAAAALRLHAGRDRLRDGGRLVWGRCRAVRPEFGVLVVPAVAEGGHDLDALRESGRVLGDPGPVS